jgi:hypothetical protein
MIVSKRVVENEKKTRKNCPFSGRKTVYTDREADSRRRRVEESAAFFLD